MFAPLKEKNDIKIFILYLLRNINIPMEFNTINDIVVQDEIVHPFDFADCFAELLEAGNIAEIKVSPGVLKYKITEQGIVVADTLNSQIMRIIRERSLRSAYRLLDFQARGASAGSRIINNGDGTFEFQCEITERGKNTLKLSVIVDNQKRAEHMKYNFDEYTENIYTELITLISGDAKTY